MAQTRPPVATTIVYNLTGQTDFTVPFEYLARKYVELTLLGITRQPLVMNSDYRFVSKTVVSLNVNPGAGFTQLEIRRNTSATERLVDFHDGSLLRASDLNVSQVQSIHVAEEARDSVVVDSIGIDDEFNLDARNKRIVNLADGVTPTDACTVRQAISFSEEGGTGALRSQLASASGSRLVGYQFGDYPIVYRTLAERLYDSVSVKDYGAIGDGVADDTLAIRNAFARSNCSLLIPAGIYRVTDIINVTGSNIHIRNYGVFSIDNRMSTLCVVSGSDVTLQGLHIDGKRNIGFAVKVTGDRSIIRDCVIENLYGTTTNGCALNFEGDIEFVAQGNTIRNVDAAPNSIIGDAIGACRAILVSHTTARSKHGIIKDNIIDVVVGEEGDAIQVICNDGTLPFKAGNVTITQNLIKDCNRRAIKIQASDCIVTNNEHVNTLGADRIPHPGPLINVVVGSGNIIRNNKVDAGGALNGIYVSGKADALLTGTVVSGNTVVCAKGSQGGNGVYLEYVKGFACEDNTVENGNNFALAVGFSSHGTIRGNIFSGDAGSSGKPAVNITSNCSRMVVSGNVNLSGARSEFIRCSAQLSVVRDNHNFSPDTSTNVRAVAAAVGTLIDDNTNVTGLAVYGSAADLKASYLGPGNRGLGVGSSAPGVSFVVDHPHEHAELHWARGDVAWNANASGSTTAGWRCTGSGVGTASTWRSIPDNTL